MMISYFVIYLIFTAVQTTGFHTAHGGTSGKTVNGFEQGINHLTDPDGNTDHTYVSQGSSFKSATRSSSRRESYKLGLTQDKLLSRNRVEEKLPGLSTEPYASPWSTSGSKLQTVIPQSHGQIHSRNIDTTGDDDQHIQTRSMESSANRLDVDFVFLNRRGSLRKGTTAKDSPPRSPSPPKADPANKPATSSSEKSPPLKNKLQTVSSSESVSQQKFRSMLSAKHRLTPATKTGSHPVEIYPPTAPTTMTRSPSPPGLRHTMSSRNLLANLNLGHTSPPGSESGQKDSPRPSNKLEAKPMSPPRTGVNLISPSSTPLPHSGKGKLEASNTDTRWPSPGRILSKEKPKVDIHDLPQSPFDRPASPKRSFSPGTAGSDDLPSPTSAFGASGFSVPSWAVSSREPSPERPRSPTKEEAIAELAELRGPKPPTSRAGGERSIKKFMRLPSLPSPKARPNPPPLKIQSMSSRSSSSSIATSPFGSPEYQSRPPFERPDPEAYKDLSDSLQRGGSASKLPPAVVPLADLPLANPIPKPPP